MNIKDLSAILIICSIMLGFLGCSSNEQVLVIDDVNGILGETRAPVIFNTELNSELALAAQKCHKAGIAWSGIFLLGLAGNDPELSRKHAVESGKLINKMNPPKDNPVEWYVAPLTLSVSPGTPLWEKKKAGEFKECSSTEILREMRIMIEHTSDDLQNCVFRTNHASNYLNLSGVLSKDKERLMKLIQFGIENPRVRRPDFLRGL